MKPSRMSLTVSGGLRSDTAPLAPGKRPCLCPAGWDWRLGCLHHPDGSDTVQISWPAP